MAKQRVQERADEWCLSAFELLELTTMMLQNGGAAWKPSPLVFERLMDEVARFLKEAMKRNASSFLDSGGVEKHSISTAE